MTRWGAPLLIMLLAGCAGGAGDRSAAAPAAALNYRDINELLGAAPEESKAEILHEVDDLIERALSGAGDSLDDRTKILLLTWFVHANFESRDVAPFSLAGMLREQKAQCGGSSITLQLMARRLGYRTRTTGFFGVPNQGGHTVAEIEWNGRWHFIDPTYGAFLTADGTLEGEIVSFETLKAYRHGIWRNTFYAKSLGRLGKSYPPRSTTDLAALFGREASILASTGDYERFLEHYHGATAYAADEGKTLEAVFDADFRLENPVTVGTDDADSSDIVLHMRTFPNYDATALQFLGDMSGTYGKLVGAHAISLAGLRPNDIVSYRASLLHGAAEDLDVAPRMVEMLEARRSGNQIELKMRALRQEAALRFSARPGKRLIFDSHRFERLGAK